MKAYFSLPAFSVLFLAACSSVSSAATIIFREASSPDTTYTHTGVDIRSGSGSGTSTSNSANLVVGNQAAATDPQGKLRGVLAFDISAIPAGSTINSISLVMTTISSNAGSGTAATVGTINLHQLLPGGSAANTVVETQVNWNSWATGQNWTTPGGDFGAALASINVTSFAVDTAFTFSSVSMTSLAQSLFDAGSQLQFILISPTAEASGATHLIRFGGDNSSMAEANRPQLIIDYTVPEPSTGLMAIFSSVGLLCLRKRRG